MRLMPSGIATLSVEDMARKYYYVSPGGLLAAWKVTRDGDDQTWPFGTKDAALDFARTMGNDSWLRDKKPSGVRVQLANGQWQEERTYGDDPFPPRG